LPEKQKKPPDGTAVRQLFLHAGFDCMALRETARSREASASTAGGAMDVRKNGIFVGWRKRCVDGKVIHNF